MVSLARSYQAFIRLPADGGSGVVRLPSGLRGALVSVNFSVTTSGGFVVAGRGRMGPYVRLSIRGEGRGAVSSLVSSGATSDRWRGSMVGRTLFPAHWFIGEGDLIEVVSGGQRVSGSYYVDVLLSFVIEDGLVKGASNV